MRLTSVLLKPVVTEKSTQLAAAGKYVFQVTIEATAGAVKNEVKKLYGVDVIDVHSVILPGKKRRQGKTPRFKKTAMRKKVILTLKEGQKIELKHD